MGGDTLFRSANMVLTQIYMSNEIARETVAAMGELGLLDFRDLNEDTNAFQRTFTHEIRRLDNIERQLRYFKTQLEKNTIGMRSIYDFDNQMGATSATEIDELAERSQALEQRIASLNDNYESLKKREVELVEWRWVLRKAGSFFDRGSGQTEQIRQSIDETDDAPLLQDMEQQQNGNVGGNYSMMNIGFVTGVISQDRVDALQRILWRTLRGNLYMNTEPIDETITNPETGEEMRKNAFIIFSHGKEILAKIRKISEALGADLYSVDENSELRRDQLSEVDSRLGDIRNVLDNTKRTLDAELTQIGRSLTAWMIVIKKEKAVYNTLNKFSYDPARKTLVAEAWLPTASLGLVRSTVQNVNDRAGVNFPTIINQIVTTKTPPTYNKTNRFTLGFQTIVDAYGTAKYQEVNQGLPAIVTFPFMFAVMFGDFGHGTIMTLAAIAMITYEKTLQRRKLDELFSMAFYGRYIMLMMGLFSIYTGLIYCDAFSKDVDLFPSMWKWDFDNSDGAVTAVRVDNGYTYPFGLDWMWHDTENDLLFSNSYKMKLSIILGWAHMTLSLIWSLVNAIHFKSPIDIYGNFIPGMVFFQSIFGYLVFAIFYKWSIDWPAAGKSPPSLLNMLIYMFLSPGKIEDPLYGGQGFIQVVLVLLALACVPVMLFLKPFYLRYEHNKARARGYRGIGETTHLSNVLDDDDDANLTQHQNGANSADNRESFQSDAVITEGIGHGEGEHEFEFSEEMIHQVIHTIEFCLNCVSHTASYLRLWALSLAHQQLSIVLWKMTIAIAFKMGSGALGIFAVTVAFYLWFTLTVAILVVMEGTSAMLHALRLHWVEAMSKHFQGDGVPFEPFSFKTLLEEEIAELE